LAFSLSSIEGTSLGLFVTDVRYPVILTSNRVVRHRVSGYHGPRARTLCLNGPTHRPSF